MTRVDRRFASAVLMLASGSMSIATAQEILLEIHGDFSLGHVAGTLDITGDACPDLIVSEPPFGYGGRVRTYSGSDGVLLWELLGVKICNTKELLGSSADDCGDFDGDGVQDYVIGSASYSDPLDCVPWSGGKLSVFSGATGLSLFDAIGDETNDQFARRANGVGDVNGDGLADVAGCGQAPYVRVFLGPNGALLREHTGPGLWPSVAGVGDVNRDGFDDYIIGWMQDTTTGTFAGKAVVHSGATGQVLHVVYGIHGWEDDDSLGDHLGRSVAGVGDMNGDGTPDFAAGAPGEFSVGHGVARGFVRVYSGVDASILHHIDGDRPLSVFGYGVSGTGDINADGVPDLLVGAPYDPQPSIGKGSVAAYSGRTGTMLWRVYGVLQGAVVGDDRGFDVVGDIDLDGIDDWAFADGSAMQSHGRARVFAGFAGDAERICTATPNSTGVPAVIRTRGPISVGNNELALEVSGGVPNQFGVFFYGPTEVELPFGNGWRCAGGQLFRFNPPTQMNSSGFASRTIDFEEPPVDSGPGQWSEGSTWVVQYWYRDPMGGGAFFNLSDALAITFTP